MYKMKKIIITSIVTVIAGGYISIMSSEDKILYNENTLFNATYIIPQDLNELEEKSPIIVKGTFTGKRKVDEDKSVVGPSSISQFTVNETYKGQHPQNTIAVIEPFEIQQQDLSNIDGYLPMQENQEYLLFLRSNDTQWGKQYTIKSMNFGKYNLSNQEEITPIENKIKSYNKIKEKDFISDSDLECDKYNEIKKDIVNKYK